MVEKKDAKGVNKSEEIRKQAKAMQQKGEKPRPVVIIAALKKQGIAVSSPQVSMVLKRMGLRPARGRTTLAGAGRGGAISLDDLLAARKLVSHFGGTARALAAIEALQKFES
jgi:predicted naringenin-chalcone synthase